LIISTVEASYYIISRLSKKLHEKSCPITRFVDIGGIADPSFHIQYCLELSQIGS